MSCEYSSRERFVDGVMHALGVPGSILALTALVALAVHAEPDFALLSVAVYGVGLVATFSCSAAYNLIERPNLTDVLGRLDRSAIHLMIAGTYTPFAVLMIGGPWGHGLLAVVWAIAVLGIALQTFAPRRLKRLALPLCLVQGWAIAVALGPLTASAPQRVLVLILIGGILYTVGVLFHLWRRLPYQNAIWHGFVLLAAGCHYAAVVDLLRA